MKRWHWGALAAVIVLILAAVAFWNFYLRSQRVEPASLEKMAFPLPDKPSIAVLPFTNMSGDPKQDYLCDGISEQVIASLSQVPGIFVIARNSSFTYKGKPVKVQQVSEELGVRYVLEGSVQKSGDRVRITVQLIDAITGNHIWADKYDRELKDLFALQDEISMYILTALRVNLTEGEQARIYGVGTENIEAYMKVMKGLLLYLSRTREGTSKGIQLYEEAIALDPGYVNAYVLLGWAHLQNAWFGFTKSPAESWKEALKLGQKAVVMDDTNANAHALLGTLLAKNQTEKAIAEGEKAMALDPNSGNINALFGGILVQAKRYAEAIAKYKEAIRFNPFPPDWYVEGLIRAYRCAGWYDDEAFSTMKWALDRNPNNFDSLAWYSWTLGCAGRYAEAIETTKKAIRLNPKHPYYYQNFLGRNYFLAERYEEAIAPFKEAISRAPNTTGGNLGLIAAYSQLGRDEDARKLVEKFLEGRPGFSAKKWLDRISFKNSGDKKRFLEAFRKAGLLEKDPASETSEEAAPLPLPDKPSIAVLPFVNMSDDPKQEYFSDGITEEIITALSKTTKLFVIARNSSFTYKGKSVWIPTVGRELGVRYVLEGSVRRAGDKVRITAQLIDAKTNQHLWAERYDRELKDIFAIQDEITMKIITALQVKLTEGEQIRMWSKQFKNLDVYLKYMEARSLWAKGTKESHVRFGQVAQDIIDMAPESGVGYKLMGWHYWWLAMVGKSPRENIGKAFKSAQKALSIDEHDSASHALLGSIYMAMRKYEKAIAAGERSVELDPNGAMVHGLLGYTLSHAGRPDEAIVHLKQGLRLNPFPPYWYFVHLGRCYRQKGKYEEALEEYKKAYRLAPGSLSPQLGLTIIYSLLNREEEARSAAAKVLEINPKFSVEASSKRWPYKNKADLKLVVDALRKAGLK